MRERPAGDVDYEAGGAGYARIRQPDPTIEAAIWAALGSARTVVNVGAGAGSYEPLDRDVIAVEPSATMRAQRPPTHPAAIDATAERLPLSDDAVEAAMATITVHQWPDLEAGLAEIRRVASGPVVIMTFDPGHLPTFWFNDYAPELWTHEAGRMPKLERLAAGLGGTVRIETVPVPLTCTDGFMPAFYGRPEAFLQREVRAAQSAWNFVSPEEEAAIIHRLDQSLSDGSWDARYGHLRTQPTFDGSLRLVISEPK